MLNHHCLPLSLWSASSDHNAGKNLSPSLNWLSPLTKAETRLVSHGMYGLCWYCLARILRFLIAYPFLRIFVDEKKIKIGFPHFESFESTTCVELTRKVTSRKIEGKGIKAMELKEKLCPIQWLISLADAIKIQRLSP